jgi:hypothetical protein
VESGLISVDPAALLLESPPPVDRDPAEAYLRHRPQGYRGSTREALDAIAGLVTIGRGTASTLAWHLLRADHMAVIQSSLAERYPTTAASRMLAALRGVLKECWKLGLIGAEEYQHTDESIVPRAVKTPLMRTPSRRKLLSVLESSTREGAPATRHNGTVRVLLRARGLKDTSTDQQARAPQRPAPSPHENVVLKERPYLTKVGTREAIAHALWEADVCLRQWAFCACLAMLRWALDLWTAEYRNTHGLTFNRPSGESDTLYWRLTKIAEENKLLRVPIEAIIHNLREGDTSHSGAAEQHVCRVGHSMTSNSLAANRLKSPYRNLQELVLTLITTATPDLPL